MKKIRVIALVLALVLMVALFAACSTTGTCEVCGKENQKLSTIEVLGVKVKACPSCKAANDALGSLGGLLG